MLTPGRSSFRWAQEIACLAHGDGICLAHVQDKLGFTAEEVAPVEITAPAAAVLPSHTLPAYNGYGSYEDSAQNCISLLPQQPK